METKFLLDGPRVQVLHLTENMMSDTLPARVYAVRFDPMGGGFYLSTIKDHLETPPIIYGSVERRIEKILTSYNSRSSSTGVLLTGDKGTGKTLLMSLLANRVITELNMPVLMIRDPHSGDGFVSFIESIGECCLVFDEFGKMYSSKTRSDDNDVKQDSLLSLLDGLDKTKRLVVFSENSELDISEFMLNRPSRVYYHFRYRKLDEESIQGYCGDFDVPDDIIEDIITLARRSRIFSFDMLQTIVEEFCRFGGSIEQIVADLNIDVREDYGNNLELIKVLDAENRECEIVGSKIVNKPIGRHDYAYITIKTQQHCSDDLGLITTSDAEDDDDDQRTVHFSSDDLAYDKDGQLIYQNGMFTFVTKQMTSRPTDYMSLLV